MFVNTMHFLVDCLQIPAMFCGCFSDVIQSLETSMETAITFLHGQGRIQELKKGGECISSRSWCGDRAVVCARV